jgi:hypothetical protein
MSVKIRIQNVQSIRDATLVVDGFTVVTGPNNSGKTASQRAVRGVFTNASSGPLLRHGEDQLTVDLQFSDGNSVKWEKGDKVNRYTVNGKVLSAVGRGVPPEVAALGVMPVKAASDSLWPQIAEQFGGVLFLVDRPGSVVAEALSDVDKVGKLSEALRLSESDRRSTSSELKVRLVDLTAAEDEVQFYENLSTAEDSVTKLEGLFELTENLSEEAALVSGFRDRTRNYAAEISLFEGAPSSPFPTRGVEEASAARTSLSEASALQEAAQRAREVLCSFEGVRKLSLPETEEPSRLKGELLSSSQALGLLLSSRSTYEEALQAQAGASKINLPQVENLLKVDQLIKGLKELQRRLSDAQENLKAELSRLQSASETYDEQITLVSELLGEVGECPTCKTVCEGAHSS